MGVPASELTYGHVVAEECRRLGLRLEDYVSLYDVDAAMPFEGVDDVVRVLTRWAVCSNKVRASGQAELARLGWSPSIALFAEDFGGGPKRLGPVLSALRLPSSSSSDVVFGGDTAHDRSCAEDAGVAFALAGWNPRAGAIAAPDDLVLARPSEVLALVQPGT